MNQEKDIVINIKDPIDIEGRCYEGGFTLTVTGSMGKKHGYRRKLVNIKFTRWDVVYLAEQLRKEIEFEKKELARIIELTGFKD